MTNSHNTCYPNTLPIVLPLTASASNSEFATSDNWSNFLERDRQTHWAISRWQPFYGVTGRQIIAKVPSEEMAFIEYNQVDD